MVLFATSIKVSVNWATGSSNKVNLSDNHNIHRVQKEIQSALSNFQCSAEGSSSFEAFLWSWLWKQQSDFYTKHSSLQWCTIQLNLVAKNQQFSRYDRNSSQSYLIKWALGVWPWIWRQQTNLLAWHFGPWCCITIPGLVTAAEETSSRWTFTGILSLFCDLELDHNREIQSFHETIHLIMMYHQTKFSCKRISS